MSILGAIGLGTSVAGGIFGAIKANKAKKKQNRLISAQESRDDAWYNNQYYQNYMDSTEAQAAMKRVQDTLRRDNASVRAQAAVGGTTAEAQMAQQESNRQSMERTAESLAGNATQRRNYVDSVHQADGQRTLNARMGQSQADESGASQVMSNSLAGIASAALQMYGEGKIDKSLAKGGGVPETYTDASLSNPDGKIYYKG